MCYFIRVWRSFGSALEWGSRGRRFDSCHSDHAKEISFGISLFLRLLPFLLKITGTCGLLSIASLAAGRKHASASRRSRRFFLPGAPILVFLPRLLIIYREAMKFGQINMFFYSFIWGEYLSAMLDKPINGVRQKTDVFSQIRKKQGDKT